MDGRHETWVDRQIREASERGAFDDLPGAGKPLAFLDEPYDPHWWVKGLVQREQIDSSALLPPQLALRKEAERLPRAILEERTEQAARARVEDFNARVRQCWRRPTTGPLVVVRTLDLEAMLERWRAHHPTEAPPPAPSPPRPRHRLRDLLRRGGRRHRGVRALPSEAGGGIDRGPS